MKQEMFAKYAQKSLNIYLKKLGITLPDKMLNEVEIIIARILARKRILIKSQLENKSLYSDSIRELSKVVNHEIWEKIMRQTYEQFYKWIFFNEPKDVLLAFLKNQNSFIVLMQNSYIGYIKYVIIKNFTIVKFLNEVKKNRF